MRSMEQPRKEDFGAEEHEAVEGEALSKIEAQALAEALEDPRFESLLGDAKELDVSDTEQAAELQGTLNARIRDIAHEEPQSAIGRYVRKVGKQALSLTMAAGVLMGVACMSPEDRANAEKQFDKERAEALVRGGEDLRKQNIEASGWGFVQRELIKIWKSDHPEVSRLSIKSPHMAQQLEWTELGNSIIDKSTGKEVQKVPVAVSVTVETTDGRVFTCDRERELDAYAVKGYTSELAEWDVVSDALHDCSRQLQESRE